MNHEQAFLEAICDDPEDVSVRLIFADWLDERGDPRGELIRLQMRLETHPKHHTAKTGCPLRRRERELLSIVWPGIWKGLWPRASWALNVLPTDFPAALFCRGFVEAVSISTADFLKHAADLVRAAPLTSVRLVDREPMGERGRWGWFAREQGMSCDVPAFWKFLEQAEEPKLNLKYWKLYRSSELAHADLSRAAILYAREQSRLRLPDPRGCAGLRNRSDKANTTGPTRTAVQQ